jgi:DNA (cytosine-5)-methyltransferase 1
MIFRFVDLFCGGGGSGSGILDAAHESGKKPEGVFINHWDAAINIHSHNHPDHIHLCTGVDNVDPRVIFAGYGNIDLLWGSPECTHHSVARGGKPMSEQSRATAWCLVRWIRHKRPDIILVENVKEFQDWCRLVQKRDKSGRKVWVKIIMAGKKKRLVETTEIPFKQEPGEHRRNWLRRLSEAGYEMAMYADAKRKGERFKQWKRAIQKMGYMIEHRIIRSANYGDPTIRQRLFVYCVRIGSGKKIVWPDPTHDKKPTGDLLPWNTARHIIDFSNIGQSIFTRNKPLVKKTLWRIAIGLIKYGLRDLEEKLSKLRESADGEPFIVPQQAGGKAAGDIDDPVGAVTGAGAEAVISSRVVRLETFQVPDASDHRANQPSSIDTPVRTVVGTGAGYVATPEISMLDSCVIQNNGQSDAQSVEAPLGATLGGVKHHLMTPLLVKLRGSSHCFPVSDPLGTVSSGGLHHAIMTAFFACIGGAPTDTNEVVVGDGFEVTPFSIGTAHSGGDESRVRSLLEPLTTACGQRGDQALIRPWIYTFYSSGSPGADIDAPTPTSTVKDRMGVCYPVIEVNGTLFILDIYFRLFTLRELARAQGFPDTFSFPGTKTDGVKAVGNAVSHGTARALALAAITQNPKITPYEPDFIKRFKDARGQERAERGCAEAA